MIELVERLTVSQSGAAEQVHRLRRLRRERRDVFHQLGVVQRLAPLPESRRQRCAETPGGDAEEIDQPRSEGELFRPKPPNVIEMSGAKNRAMPTPCSNCGKAIVQ